MDLETMIRAQAGGKSPARAHIILRNGGGVNIVVPGETQSLVITVNGDAVGVNGAPAAPATEAGEEPVADASEQTKETEAAEASSSTEPAPAAPVSDENKSETAGETKAEEQKPSGRGGRSR